VEKRWMNVPMVAIAAGALVAVAVAPLGAAASTRAAPAAALSQVDQHRWTTTGDFARGGHEGTVPAPGGRLAMAKPAGRTTYTDPFGDGTASTWDYARWTSPSHRLRFGATELVSSWNADTPHGTWLQVEMRGHVTGGKATKWYVMGRWASDDTDIHRTSVPNQKDANGDISVDTFVAASGVHLTDYQLRVTLYRAPGGHARPSVRQLGAMASNVPQRATVPASPLGGAEGIELKVPRYSQDIHKGQYPQYDNGGEAWCSPTSTSMVVGYWGRGPSKKDMSWVDPSYADPQVDYAARNTYDYDYEGAGNWPFNTAYAGRFGLDGFITRLRSLTELEQFTKLGIPVVTSQSFKADELPGAGYSTSGHLMVIIGFTKSGDVIANDPASADDAAVRHVYPRANFENVWQRSSSSGGVVYVITPPGHRLPRVPGV
jgi:hypothetical protein